MYCSSSSISTTKLFILALDLKWILAQSQDRQEIQKKYWEPTWQPHFQIVGKWSWIHTRHSLKSMALNLEVMSMGSDVNGKWCPWEEKKKNVKRYYGIIYGITSDGALLESAVFLEQWHSSENNMQLCTTTLIIFSAPLIIFCRLPNFTESLKNMTKCNN